MERKSRLFVGLCLLALSSLFLASCASAIMKKRYAYVTRTDEQKWEEHRPGSSIFVYQQDGHEFVVSVSDTTTFVLAFWFLVLPMIEFEEDKFDLGFWVDRNGEQVPTALLSLSEPFCRLQVGTREISPQESRWYTGSRTYHSGFDPAELSSWFFGRKVTVHFNELHIRDSGTGASKRVLLPPLEFVTGKTYKAAIGVVGHGEVTPAGWIGIMITVSLYGLLIRSIVRRIRKTNSR